MATLLNVLGIPRWGNNQTREIEQTIYHGNVFMDYVSQTDHDVLWDTEIQGRYPTLKEMDLIEQSI